ncbi:MAG: transglycosylase domain-containing protein, partial [Anaerolineales bacterium]|nr:transglycosylase domain-containing protein [Anaerolineales bacterium]MDW8447583.1 transglycosylase domain-containing protein [Anaerolineales bacterium]
MAKALRHIPAVKILGLLGGVGALLVFTFAVFLLSLSRDLPKPESVQDRLQLPSIQILDRNGLLLYEDLGGASVRHRPLSYKDFPPCIIQATVATEDRSFFTNPGFDLKALLRAAWINLRGGRVLVGGSTITQQVVRNLLMNEEESTERTLRRKVREIILAWRLSRYLSKQEILAL